jgi:Tfp pilus tip-associated adhesin PilY1
MPVKPVKENAMPRYPGSKLLAAVLCACLGAAPIMAAADDIDIFTGASAGNAIKPRILIVLDNTSNWARQSQQWPGGLQQGQSEARAIRSLLDTLDAGTYLGLMEFVTSGNANMDGGFIRSAIGEMNDANKLTFSNKLDTIFNNINGTIEKRNSNTPYGNLMYDVYNYFAGANAYSPGGVEASIADPAGYTSAFSRFQSPLTAENTCGKSFVIFIGNPNSSGPQSDSAANTAALNLLNNNRAPDGSLIPVTQLGLPNFVTTPLPTSRNVGTTSACYPDSTAAQAGLAEFSSQCSTFTEGCQIGATTAPLGPIACPAGTQSYTVKQSVYHPAITTPGQPVQGTVTTATSPTNGYYASSTAVSATDNGTLVCPATTTTTSGSNTSTTTYSCSYSVGSPIGSPTVTTAGPVSTSACYSGVGTGTDNWNPATTSDFGGLVCPVNSSCTYSGVNSSSSGGCGNQRRVLVTQTATALRQYTVTQTITPTIVNSAITPAYTSTSVLGTTSQCYASGPTSTTDYAASCSGANVSCTYNNAPTSSTLSACPGGTNAYKVDGNNLVLTDVQTGTTTTDTGPRNADEWARLLHDRGVPVAGSSISPSVTTYTIDVYNSQPNAVQTALMMSMANAGGGRYFAAKDEKAILDALKQIIIEIQAVNTSFASTSLPVNATNRSQNENQVFIGMFRPDPDAKPRWFGNLKRYQLIAAGSNVELGDVNGKIAVNTLTGFVTPCATSYWSKDSGSYWSGMGLNPDPASDCSISKFNKYSDAPDGPQVEKGAAAQVLRQGNGAAAAAGNIVNRNMLTVSNGSFVAFDSTSSGLNADLVKFIRGEDVNDEKKTGALTTTRPSIHGDVIHSRPLPVNYGGTTGVTVYYGANDGTMHAVDADTGIERWSFVAPEFFGRLARLKDNSPLVSYPNLSGATSPSPLPKDYFFDGSIGVFQNTDSSKVWIYPSMRRGGRMIYGIDVSAPSSPVFKWKAGCPNLGDDTGCTAGMSGIGQTWSTPSVAFIKGYPNRPVVVFGGGYDSCEDANTASPSCSGRKGGFVYILDAETGDLLRSFPTDRAVAADVSMVDIDNDGMPDYAYAADTGGNLYRINFIDSPTGRFGLPSATWAIRKVAFAGGGRKFLFAPALLANQGKVYVAIGSGDREHPLESQYPFKNVVNRFYVYRDDLASLLATPATDLDAMVDYTAVTDCQTTPVMPGSGPSGWFMDLNQYGKGEQVVTSALIASGMVAFSTNRPIPPDAGTCSTSLGQARGYWVNLFNASGAIGVDGACGGRRSSEFVGGGLAPSPVLATSVPIGRPGAERSVSVVIGAAQKEGGVSVPISPGPIRPTNKPQRKRSYSYVSGQ